MQMPNVSLSPVQTETPTQSTQTVICQQNQLSATLSAQGAAGNIYAKLELTNTGKTTCEVILGNTVTTMFDAKNIVINNKHTVPSENYMLAPGAKVYSQIHFPNGPQCQSGIAPESITFLYKTAETSVNFTPDAHTGKLFIQACRSAAEKTTVDIWPLSKTPITP